MGDGDSRSLMYKAAAACGSSVIIIDDGDEMDDASDEGHDDADADADGDDAIAYQDNEEGDWCSSLSSEHERGRLRPTRPENS